MTTENRIVGPGYYPKRPGRRPDFAGAPDHIRIYSSNGQWDSIAWQGAGKYSVQCIIRASQITDIRVYSSDNKVLHVIFVDCCIGLGAELEFEIYNPTPSTKREVYGTRWQYPGYKRAPGTRAE